MRLVSYNILDGGEGRADPLAEVIEAARPDVVALVEADDPTVVARVAGRLGMDVITGHGRTHAVALLSRWTITESIDHAALVADFDACLLEATVRSPAGESWPIGVVHLHARATEEDEARRERELDVVLNAFDRHRRARTPHLLCGDFNANAPTQQIDLARAHPTTRDAAQSNGGHVPRRVVERVVNAGYLDAVRSFDPATADTTGTFTTQHPQQRVDYVFAYNLPRRRLTSAWIEQDRLAKYASDHFPIGVEIG